jgi:hypothetical protein
MTLADALQIAGWLLTVSGQFQVARKQRQGFVTWIAANLVLIGLAALAGLWWSIGMYCTNVVVCLWSYQRWGAQPTEASGSTSERLPWRRVQP